MVIHSLLLQRFADIDCKDILHSSIALASYANQDVAFITLETFLSTVIQDFVVVVHLLTVPPQPLDHCVGHITCHTVTSHHNIAAACA